MEDEIRNLRGSKHLNEFRWRRKGLHRQWYAIDLDLILLDKKGILCLIEYKFDKDYYTTWAEDVVYKQFIDMGLRVFLAHEQKFDWFKIYELDKDVQPVFMYEGHWELFERNFRNRKYNKNEN